MRTKGFVLTVVAAIAFVLVSNTAARAEIVYDFAFHISQELYYMDGTSAAPGNPTGTQVTCSLGCQSFNVPGAGLPSGNIFWKVSEEGFYGTEDANEFTKIEYTVVNDAFDELITSFHVPTKGLVPLTIVDPDNWEGTYNASTGTIEWVADSGFGIDGDPSETFIVIYEEFLPIVFAPNVLVDLDDNSEFDSVDWVISTVPVPGAVFLGAIGLAGVGWLKRRFA